MIARNSSNCKHTITSAIILKFALLSDMYTPCSNIVDHYFILEDAFYDASDEILSF